MNFQVRDVSFSFELLGEVRCLRLFLWWCLPSHHPFYHGFFRPQVQSQKRPQPPTDRWISTTCSDHWWIPRLKACHPERTAKCEAPISQRFSPNAKISYCSSWAGKKKYVCVFCVVSCGEMLTSLVLRPWIHTDMMELGIYYSFEMAMVTVLLNKMRVPKIPIPFKYVFYQKK